MTSRHNGIPGDRSPRLPLARDRGIRKGLSIDRLDSAPVDSWELNDEMRREIIQQAVSSALNELDLTPSSPYFTYQHCRNAANRAADKVYEFMNDTPTKEEQ